MHLFSLTGCTRFDILSPVPEIQNRDINKNSRSKHEDFPNFGCAEHLLQRLDHGHGTSSLD